jgi:Fe-S-cluster containining protein
VATRLPGVPHLDSAADPLLPSVLIRGFALLHRVWDGFREARDAVQAATGKPLCVDGCGLCCVTNTPSAWGIEVTRAASWLHEQTPAYRAQVLDRVETWLTKPVLEVEPPTVPSFINFTPLMGKQKLDARNPEHQIEMAAQTRGRCPLLGPDLRCMVYEVRPLGCRAWGLTTIPEPYCKRPQGLGESATTRTIFAGHGTAMLRARIRSLLEGIKSDPKLTNTLLFPTGLYAQFREAKLIELLPHVPTTRLMMGQNAMPPRLFAEPLDAPLVLSAESGVVA